MKAILIHSGGLDSTVLLYQLLKQGHTVKALSVHYGQKHSKELEYAKSICKELQVEHQTADLQNLSFLFASSSLVNPQRAISEKPYDEASLKTTVVPNRNMIFLALATAWAISNQFNTVAYGAHASDGAVYPDCREVFTKALQEAIYLADWHSVQLHSPFVQLDKSDIVRLGAQLNVPFANTWSCYKGETIHCGRCGTCIQRRLAFHSAAIDDPTEYAPDSYTIESLLASSAVSV
jgi:7-cyano-7-deazaguanine synthase